MRCCSHKDDGGGCGLPKELILLSAWHNTPHTLKLREADDSRLAAFGQERGVILDLNKRNLVDTNYFRLPARITRRQRHDLVKISPHNEVGALLIPRSNETTQISAEHSKQLALGFCALLIGQHASDAQTKALTITNTVLRYFDVVDEIFKQLSANKDLLKINKEGIENFRKYLNMLASEKSLKAFNAKSPELRRTLHKWGFVKSAGSSWGGLAGKTQSLIALDSLPEAIASVAERESVAQKMKDLLEGKSKTVSAKVHGKKAKKPQKRAEAPVKKETFSNKVPFLESILAQSGLDTDPKSKLDDDQQDEYRSYKKLLEAKQPLDDIYKWLSDLHRPFGRVNGSVNDESQGSGAKLKEMKKIIDHHFNNNWDVIKASVLDRSGRQGFVFESALIQSSQDYVERLKTGIVCQQVSEKVRQVLDKLLTTSEDPSETQTDSSPTPSFAEDRSYGSARVTLSAQGRYIAHIFLNSLLRSVRDDEELRSIIAPELEERVRGEEKSFEWLRNYQIAKSLAAPYCHPNQIMYVASAMSTGSFDMRRLFTPEKQISLDTLLYWKPYDEHFKINIDRTLLPQGEQLSSPASLKDVAASIKAMIDKRRATRPKDSMYGDPGYNPEALSDESGKRSSRHSEDFSMWEEL